MAYVHTWNSTFEANPADSDSASEGAMRIRYLKVAIRERLAKDHYLDTSGTDADHGEHKKVTLRVASSPTEESDKGYLFSKDVSSKAELHWRDEDGNEIQATTGGHLNYNGVGDGTNVLTATPAEINTAADGDYARNIHDHSNLKILTDSTMDSSGNFGVSNKTTLSANATSGDGTVDVNDTTGYATDDDIRIYLNDGSFDDTTIGGIAGSTITLNDNLSGDADSGNHVYEITFPTIGVTDGSIGQTQITASAVGQSELKTTYGTVNTNNTTATGETLTLPGGQFAFFPQIKIGNSSATAYLFPGSDGIPTSSTSMATLVTLRTSDGDYSAYVRSDYVQSSPPYNFGDGIVQGFVYLLLDSSGNIIGTYIAEDPPWYGNTSKTPKRQYRAKDGKEYAEFRHSRYQQTGNLEDFGILETITREITTELKNEGMEELPHPFLSAEVGQNIVLIDPTDEDLTRRIVNEMLVGGNPTEIFKQDYVRVDNIRQTQRRGPPNVAIHRARWRNSR